MRCTDGLRNAKTMPAGADPKVWARALKIHKKAIVIDGHNDIPSPMVDEDFDLATDSVGKFHRDGDPFHTDLARLKQSGITGEFFSIYVSGTDYQKGGKMRRAMDLIDATIPRSRKTSESIDDVHDRRAKFDAQKAK
jgi:microsomal dipeptidase-like Zn-dependent dipeptidase